MKKKSPSPLFPVFALLVCALAIAGCRSPQSLCQEYVDTMNDMFGRCMIPLEFFVVHPTSGERGCHIVQRIPDPDPIVNECMPWANAIDTPEECAEVDPSSLPAFCSARSFQVVE
jgi:hypothetical protein